MERHSPTRHGSGFSDKSVRRRRNSMSADGAEQSKTPLAPGRGLLPAAFLTEGECAIKQIFGEIADRQPDNGADADYYEAARV
jgi:hypothetical protein